MLANVVSRTRREAFCLKWAALGVYLFLSAFFWASGPAPLRGIFYLFLLLPFLAVLPWRRWRLDEYGGYFTLSALVFAAYSVAASLWGRPEDIGFFLKQWVFLAFWLCGIAWLFYHRPVDLQRLYSVGIAVGVVCALVTVYGFFMGANSDPEGRLSGFGLAENSTVVAQIFGVAALLAYIKSLQADSAKLSWLFLGAALVCAWVILLSGSRGAALALVLVALAALVIIRPRPSIWVPQVILGGLVLGAAIPSVGVATLLEVRVTAFSLRDVIWRELLQRVPGHLLFGIGYYEDSRILIADVGVFHHAHNSWLDILYYGGALGLLLALWHGVLLARTFSCDRDLLPLYLWWVYGCLCLLTNGSSLLTRPDAQWLMYWVPAGLLAAVVMSRRRCPNP